MTAAHRGLAAVSALALTMALASAVGAQSDGGSGSTASAPPTVAPAPVLLIQLPFGGQMTDDLRDDVETGVRSALLTRGTTGPDRTTVRNAMGVAAPQGTEAIVAFGRSMGGTHVLTGIVRPLTGQFNLTLRLYEVATSQMAETQRNIGGGEEGTALPQMLEALFAPNAMQLSPEARARAEEERRRQEEERRRAEEARRREEEARRAEEARRREEEARRRADEARRRREEADRNRRVYRFAEGGPLWLGGGMVIGARLSDVPPPSGVTMPRARSSVVGGFRIEGGWSFPTPVIGIQVGLSFGALMSEVIDAITLGPTVRIALPAAAFIPLRASAGVSLGLFQGVSGGHRTGFWFSGDVRAEFDPIPQLSIYAGIAVDYAGFFPAFIGTLGLTAHIETSPRPRNQPDSQVQSPPQHPTPGDSQPSVNGDNGGGGFTPVQ